MKSKTLGMLIAELRKKQGMTQLDLANKMGVTDKAVSKWERDLSCPDIHSFTHLAEVLNVSVDELLQNQAGSTPAGKKLRTIVNLIGKGVALATGIAVVVLSVLDAIEARESIILLGIGLACIALQALSDNE